MAGVLPAIGDLRHSVRVERRARLDANGEPVWDSDLEWDGEAEWDDGDGDGAGNFEAAQWRTFIDRRAAKLQATRGGEEVIANRLSGLELFDVWMRCDAKTALIRVGDRIIDNRDESRILNVRWIGNLDGRGQFLLLQCQAGAAD